MWHGMYLAGGWPMLFGGLLVLGSLIGVIVWAVHRATDRRETAPCPAKSPLDHLKERYARGEITRDEFQQIQRDLLSS